MDLITRAVDWVVTRPATDEALSSVPTGAVDSGWELLPGDIFTKLLSCFDAAADGETLRNLRYTCKAWKHNTDSRLQHLFVKLTSGTLNWRISETFTDVRSIDIRTTFDAPLQGTFIFEDISACTHLTRLVMKNCKRKLSSGLAWLHQLNNLQELHLDGALFQRMRLENITLFRLKELCVNDCSTFSPEDYHHIGTFRSIHRLLLTHVTSSWKEECDFLKELTQLSDLSVVHSTSSQGSVTFDCLNEASALRSLALEQTGIRLSSLQSLPSLPFLERLSLDGCMELNPQCVRTLGAKCPKLTSLIVVCQSDAWVTDVGNLSEMQSLKCVKLVNCHGLDLASLKKSTGESVRITHTCLPDMDLQNVTKTLEYSAVEAFLKESSHPGVPVSGEYFTPSTLSDLVAKGRFDILKLLIAYGADVDYGSPNLATDTDASDRFDCSTALHFAVHRGDKEGVKQLLNLGARVNAHCTEDSRTPLHLAASSGNLEMTRILLSADANVNAVDYSNRTPLHAAVSWKAREIITELLKHGADPHAVDLDLLAPICYAVSMTDLDLLQFLVRSGMDVNEGAYYEFSTPLHVAVRTGKWKIVRFLLEHGADPCAKDVEGTTPLLLAGRSGNCSLVESLLDSQKPRGEELDERDNVGNTLLHYAASGGWTNVVERLILLGVDVNRTDPKGFTALYYADQQRHSKIVSRLTREGGLARWLTRPKLHRCPRIGRSQAW